MKPYLKTIIDNLLIGQEVIVSDKALDELTPYGISNFIATKQNPNQLGIQDRWVAWIKATALARANNSNPYEIEEG